MTYLLIYFLINLFLTIQEAVDLVDKGSNLKKYKAELAFALLFGAPTCILAAIVLICEYIREKND